VRVSPAPHNLVSASATGPVISFLPIGVRVQQGLQFGRDGSAYQPRLLMDQISRPWNRAKR